MRTPDPDDQLPVAPDSVQPPTKAARRVSWRGLVLAGLGGLLLYQLWVWGFPYAVLAFDTIRGVPIRCDTASAWKYHRSDVLLSREQQAALKEVSVRATDASMGLVQVRTASFDFWVKRQGESYDGPTLIAYLLAEHRWMEASNPALQVKPGDVVLDCGAHVGVFTYSALRRGAARVVAFEIDPANLECLRRNFTKEIAAGKVEVIPKGVWSSEGSMDFSVSTINSGMGSLIFKDPRGATIKVPLTKIDMEIEKLGLARVDFIKMDIEGAEREALAGAAATLRRFKPTLALDSYHRPDDPEVLPRVIHGANPGYTTVCGPCERAGGAYQSHVLYYH